MKRLVICCDGTWNSADQMVDGEPCPTNVVRFATRVAKRDQQGISQIVFYDQGVGTGNSIDRVSGGALGKGLEANIHDAYRFLLGNYELGDELFVLGFSRGAFTARSLIGMVRKCGILHQKFAKQYAAATHLYCNNETPKDTGPTKFRQQFCSYGDHEIDVEFVGVWDTVGALGIPVAGLRWLTGKDKYQFHDTELSGSVRHACQALAIDEHRGPFRPAIWEAWDKPDQDVEQVWFCGAHSDVGGGYGKVKASDVNGQPVFKPQLSDISLQWMIEKAQAAGLWFDPEVIATNPIAIDPLAVIHDSKTGFYNVAPSYDRPIGLAIKKKVETNELDPTQTLHPTVRQRWDNDKKYRPDSLKNYFKKIGDPRGAED
ncbi:MAG: DUF2235 domain-containing protein [Pseudomonadota bacterium]